MSKISQIVKEHKIAVIIGLFLSVIVSFPQIYFRIDQKEAYQGIDLIHNSPWLPRVREVQDGHLNWGSIYYKEGKDLPYLFQPFGSAVVAYMGQVFTLDIGNTILLSLVVLTPIVFLLLYYLVFLLSTSRLIALASSITVFMIGPIIYISGLKRLIQGISPRGFTELAGPVNPSMIYIPFFAFLISFWVFYQKKNWKWGVISTVILGVNFYNYFYTWTYLYAFGGILILIYLLKKNWHEALKISYVFIGGFLLAIPYVINLYRSTLHPVYEAAGIRAGVVLTHAPMSVGLMVVIALIIFLVVFRRDDKSRYLFSLALLLTPFITMNQQIITGRAMQSAHYHWYFHKPIAIVFIVWAVFKILNHFKLEFYRKALLVIIILSGFYVTIFTQVTSYLTDHNDGLEKTIDKQKYGLAMEWLSNNGKKDAVVFANDDASDLTVIYTPLNVFHHFKGPLSLTASEERVREALFTYYRLEGVGKDNAEELFHTEERVRISTIMYGMYYRPVLGSYEAIPSDKIDNFTTLYKETFDTTTAQWLYDIWRKYDVEYLVWDKMTNPSWKLDRFSYLEKVEEFGSVAIYRLKR